MADDEATCGLAFSSAEELHNHVVQSHFVNMKKDAEDKFCCGWKDCSRSSKRGGQGFPQRSKIERHIQTHTASKYHILA